MEGEHGYVDWDSFDDKDELISLSEEDFEDDASVGSWVDSKSSSSSSSSDDDDDEWEERRKRLCLALVAYRILKKKGMKKKRHHSRRRRQNRRSAEVLLQEGVDDGLFRVEYRMSPQSFHKLVGLIRNDLEPKKGNRRKDYLDPETKVMMTLRWLAGGQYVDQCHRNGVSKSSVFRAFMQVINAINANPLIGHPKWPTTIDECNEIASRWAKLSGPSESRGLFTTVIGMLDGLLVCTVSPMRSETNRPDDFRSGHKKRIGLNCQAICDSSLRFLFVSIKSPGKTNDLKAYRMSKLSELIENLPEGYFCGGDNAYCNSKHLLVPYPGQNLSQRFDSFNYFLSQLCIRIENAFALLVGRWGILWRPLHVRLKHQPKIIKCLCKLHNFCIDEKERGPPLSGPGGTPPAVATTRTEEEFNTQVLANRSEWRTEYQFQ